jgi:hypothetical protein
MGAGLAGIYNPELFRPGPGGWPASGGVRRSGLHPFLFFMEFEACLLRITTRIAASSQRF